MSYLNVIIETGQIYLEYSFGRISVQLIVLHKEFQ